MVRWRAGSEGRLYGERRDQGVPPPHGKKKATGPLGEDDYGEVASLFQGGFDPWRSCVRGGLVKWPRGFVAAEAPRPVRLVVMAADLQRTALDPPLNSWILSTFCLNKASPAVASKAPCFCPSNTPSLSFQTARSLLNCTSVLDYSGNVCSWMWQAGSVRIHSWLYKRLIKAQKLILCICFQCKADKSGADSDTLGSRGRRAVRQRRRSDACLLQLPEGRGMFTWAIHQAPLKHSKRCF